MHGVKRWIVRAFTDDRSVMSVIAINAVVLFLMKFDELAAYESRLRAFDDMLTVYFLCEAVTKLRLLGRKAYFANAWNRFDFIVVAVTAPTLLEYVVDMPDVSYLMLLRMARIAKFFRFIRFVPNIGQLLDGVLRAAKASIFVLLAFFLCNFVISLFACYIFKPYFPEHFGNPLISFYSIFQVITVEAWNEIPSTMIESNDAIGPAFAIFVRIFFMTLLVGGGLFGLSIVNAIFVDEMLRNENDLIEERLDEVNKKLDAILSEKGLVVALPPRKHMSGEQQALSSSDLHSASEDTDGA